MGVLLFQNCDLVIFYEEVAIVDNQVKIINFWQRELGEFVYFKVSDC